jgi:hypothetical protein
MQKKLLGSISVDFSVNRSTTDHIFCICQILEKQWEYNEAVHEQFTDLKKALDSLRWKVWYNILIEFDETSKANNSMCLNEQYSRVPIGRYFLLRML